MHIRQGSRLLAVAFTSASGYDLATTPMVCTSFASCCDLCGENSQRCARGPASQAHWMSRFFHFTMPVQRIGLWDVVAGFYGMIPYLVGIFALLHLLVFHRQLRTWDLRVLVILSMLFNSTVHVLIAKSLGACESCDRPCGSLVHGFGMPSGHALSSIGLCCWMLLEIWLGLARADKWSLRKQLSISLLVLLVFAPEPYTRVYLGDHTPQQVEVGSCVGAMLGVMYFLLLRCFAILWDQQHGTTLCGRDSEIQALLSSSRSELDAKSPNQI